MIMTYRVLFERFLLPIPMEFSPAGVGHCILLCILDCILFCIIIIVLFIQCLIYSIHLAFRTHVSSCVRGGINHS
jgi:hypothetical protein